MRGQSWVASVRIVISVATWRREQAGGLARYRTRSSRSGRARLLWFAVDPIERGAFSLAFRRCSDVGIIDCESQRAVDRGEFHAS